MLMQCKSRVAQLMQQASLCNHGAEPEEILAVLLSAEGSGGRGRQQNEKRAVPIGSKAGEGGLSQWRWPCAPFCGRS